MANDEMLQLYANDAQAYALMMNVRDEIFVCGRGTGKGFIQAFRLLAMVQRMPGCTLGFVGPSYKKTLMTTLPSMLIHLERVGIKRDIHYVVNKRPPKALHWKSPLFIPESYEHTITFYNGSTVQLITQDREGASNGLSLDGLIIDEAKFIDYEKLKNETFQTNRGSEMYFGNCHLHHGMTITCDMPVTKKGSWFLKYKDDMDPRVVEVVEGLVFEYQRYKRRFPMRTAETDKYIRYLERELLYWRKRCVLYKEYPSTINLGILGEDFIRRMKRELPPMTFLTSIMCVRVGIAQDGFYSGIVEAVNYYEAPNRHYLDSFDYIIPEGTVEDCRMDEDLDPNKPIIIGMDANTNINWLVAAQVDSYGKLRILKSFYVKYERKIPELIDDFSLYYAYHRRKQVVFYYDHTFVGQVYYTHGDDIHTEVEKHLRRNGWLVDAKYIGQTMPHLERNLLINRMFRGRARHQILINRSNNEDLLISIESAGVYNGKKDKRAEKLAETEEDRLEARTDGSDAFDTVCIGVENFPVIQAEMSGLVTSM